LASLLLWGDARLWEIGGLTLGGGIGTLMPKYGAACDNVQSAEVVTVDSRQVEASHNSNSDLFWAMRGGGGNFGVATSFEYRLYPVTEVLAGALEYPAHSQLLHAFNAANTSRQIGA